MNSHTNYVDQHVGRKLQLYRKAEGLSRSDVAKVLEIEKADLKLYELGQERLPPQTIINFCLLVDIRPRALFDDLELMTARRELGHQSLRTGSGE